MIVMLFMAVALLVFVVASVLLVVRALVRPTGLGEGAACGQCKYSIIAPIPDRCPECGELIAEVGLITRSLASRGRWRTVGAIFGWSVICTLLATIVTGITAQRVVMSSARGPFGRMHVQTSGPVTFHDVSTQQIVDLFHFEIDGMFEGYEHDPDKWGLLKLRVSDTQSHSWYVIVDNSTLAPSGSGGSPARSVSTPPARLGATRREKMHNLVSSLVDAMGHDVHTMPGSIAVDVLTDHVLREIGPRASAAQAMAVQMAGPPSQVHWGASGSSGFSGWGSSHPYSLHNPAILTLIVWSNVFWLWLLGCTLILWRRQCLVRAPRVRTVAGRASVNA